MAVNGKASELDYYISRDGEHGRLDKQSQGIYELLGNRFVLTPLEQPKKIADIGCGTGVVTSYLARKYKDARMIGVDLHHDPAMHLAPNVSFVEGNIENVVGQHPELQNETFDYVFTRLLIFGFKDWPQRVKEIASMLKPGGHFENQECVVNLHKDGHPVPDSRWIKNCEKAAGKLGLDWRIGLNIASYMKEAGLEVEQRIEYQWPLGTWLEKEKPETAKIGRVTIEDNIMPIKRICDNMLHGSVSEAELEDIKASVDIQQVHSPGIYWPYIVTVGRKPL